MLLGCRVMHEMCDNSYLILGNLGYVHCCKCGRSWGPTVTVLCCVLGNHSIVTVTISMKEFDWLVPAKLSVTPDKLLRGNLQWTNIPSKGAIHFQKQRKKSIFLPIFFELGTSWKCGIMIEVRLLLTAAVKCMHFSRELIFLFISNRWEVFIIFIIYGMCFDTCHTLK